MKRFSAFLCICLLCAALTVTAALAGEVSSGAISLDLAAGSVEIYENEGVTYCVQNEVTQATTGGVIIRQSNSGSVATSNTVTVTGGSCKMTISSLNIEANDWESPIYVKNGASLDLTLLGSSTVTGDTDCAGIQVPAGATLTIGGSGGVTAIGGRCGAGIGGGFESAGGTVIISGGTVIATGGQHGAGIGGGDDSTTGTVIINGGTVTATGGMFAAGIGGGRFDAGGTITITGGAVTAEGGDYGADIGAGYHGTFDAVTISEKATVPTAKVMRLISWKPFLLTSSHYLLRRI